MKWIEMQTALLFCWIFAATATATGTRGFGSFIASSCCCGKKIAFSAPTPRRRRYRTLRQHAPPSSFRYCAFAFGRRRSSSPPNNSFRRSAGQHPSCRCRLGAGQSSSDVEEDNPATTSSRINNADGPIQGIIIHHTAIKTANIATAIQFYGLLGFEVTCKFRAGPARAAWLELITGGGFKSGKATTPSSSSRARLEIIEVPSYMLPTTTSKTGRPRVVDLMERQELLGYNHMALDVTSQISNAAAAATLANPSRNATRTTSDDEAKDFTIAIASLSDWIQQLNATSYSTFGKTLRVALEPRQQLIGNSVYELAFIYDADGSLVELLNLQTQLPQSIESGWEPLQLLTTPTTPPGTDLLAERQQKAEQQ